MNRSLPTRFFALAAVAVLFYATYGFANYISVLRTHVPEIVFEWERQVSFSTWSILPYWSLNLLYGLGFFLIPQNRLKTYAARLVLAQLIAVACFLLFPLTFSWQKPETDGLYGFFFAQLGAFDRPFNQAPSLHIILCVIVGTLYASLGCKGGVVVAAVAVACAFGAGVWQGLAALAVCLLLIAANRVHWLVWAWFALIGVSVLTTWQHHFIDIPTGLAVGALVLQCLPEGGRIRFRRPDKRRLKWAAFYTLLAVFSTALAVFLGGAWLWLCWFGLAFATVAPAYACFGAAWFGKRENGQHRFSAKILLLPYFALARLNAYFWLRGANRADEILPQIHLGSILAAPHFAAVFDLTAEFSARLNAAPLYRSFPLLDMVLPSTEELNAAAAALDRHAALAQNADKPLLVCCALGYSRSAAVLALWLVQYRAMTLPQALDLIRSRRPNIVLSEEWRQQIATAASCGDKENHE